MVDTYGPDQYHQHGVDERAGPYPDTDEEAERWAQSRKLHLRRQRGLGAEVAEIIACHGRGPVAR